MTTNKWHVKYYPAPEKAWGVSRWDDELAYWEFQEFHPTHAEAMREADRRARTVEVTLPRDPDAREVARAGEWTRWKGAGWAITSNDPERAALHVLAYYYRKARA